MASRAASINPCSPTPPDRPIDRFDRGVRAFDQSVATSKHPMFHGGSGGGGGATCMSLPLGKYLRRALRGTGRSKPRPKHKDQLARQRSSSSVELIASASSLSSASASWSASAAESVVRVVLWSGLVEVYAGVVLACTVIRRHPPGLCLAHTDVFRNPHRATLRPLEPLFPGQKFFLLPETTVRKLQRDIPLDVRTLPAVPFPQAVAADGEEDEEETSTEVSSPSRSRSWSEEERPPAAAAAAAPDGCRANDFYVNRERWAECQFKSMVERGLAAAESSSSSSRRSAANRTDKKRRRTKQRNRDLLGGSAPPPLTARAWEPSLPPVQEEATPSSPEPKSTSSEARTTDHETH